MLFLEEVVKIRRSDCLEYVNFDNKYLVDTKHPILPVDGFKNVYEPGFILNHYNYFGSNGYQNTPLKFIDYMNEYFNLIPNLEDYSFVDIGSGKGKILLYNLLSKSKYKKYASIEIDANLYNISLNNLKTTNIVIDKQIDFFNINILDYDCINEPSVYFIFNPFEKKIFKKFIDNNIDTLIKSESFLVFSLYDFDFSLEYNYLPVYIKPGIIIYYLGKE